MVKYQLFYVSLWFKYIKIKMEVKIYVLIDPITLKIRYIGRTKNSLNIRLTSHIVKSKFKKNYKDCWVNSLVQKGYKPIIKLFKTINGWEESYKYEQSLINKSLNYGFNLVNLHDRGIGGLNRNITKEQKIKISNTLKQRYKEGRIFPTKSTPVIVYDLFGKELYKFNYQKDCALFLNISCSAIEHQVAGKVLRCGSYQIRSFSQPNPGIYKIYRDPTINNKCLNCINTATNEELIFNSYKEAAVYFNTPSSNISWCVKNKGLIKRKYLCLNLKKSCELLETPEEDNQQPSIIEI